MAKKRKYSIRAIYQEATNRELPKDFDIHHINLDPEDNNILNLLALPRKVHQDYHRIYTDVTWLDPVGTKYFVPSIKDFYIHTGCIDLALQNLNNMREVYIEYCGWFNFRNYLLGRLPNLTRGTSY